MWHRLAVRWIVIILLALLLVGGAIWWIRKRRRTDDPPAGAPPGLLPAAPGGPPQPIAVAGLTKRFGGRTAVDSLEFRVDPGRVTAFLGPNGAGKTTTLRLLLGLSMPDAGSATIGGRRYPDIERPIRQVGAVLESSAAHPGRTGRDHLRLACRAGGVPAERADEVLALVGLTGAGRRRVGTYSLGMRQRLGIAAALIGNPPVLILDEPANGLDPDGVRWLRHLLRGLAAQGRTVLVSSHQLAEIQALADDIVVIAAGRLVAAGSVEAVAGSLGRAGRVRVATPEPERLTHALGPAATVTAGPDGQLYVAGVDAAVVGEAARQAGIPVHELVTERSDLESLYLELIR
jgi:ABC-2 type transport system ATP-binding protein